MKNSVRWLLIAVVGSCMTLGADSRKTMVGAASIDITPEYQIRLNGYAVRKGPSEGAEQKLFAKAFAMGSADRGDLTLILTIDNLGAPAAVVEKVYSAISSKTKLRREQFALCASHTHLAPMLSGMTSNIFGMDIPKEQWETIDRYTRETTEKLIKVGLEAIEKVRPGELFWSMGSVSFAKNRRTENGPVDHDAPVLAAKVDGKWTAVLANYACHCTTLGGEFNKFCGLGLWR